MKKIISTIVIVAIATVGLSFASPANAANKNKVSSTLWVLTSLAQDIENGEEACYAFIWDSKEATTDYYKIVNKVWKKNKKIKKGIQKPTKQSVYKALDLHCVDDSYDSN